MITNSVRSSLAKPRIFGQRVALFTSPERGNSPNVYNSYGKELDRAIEKVGAELMQMTALERMNSRYPGLRLCRLPEDQRELLGEPDVAICFQYYRKFQKAIMGEGNEPVSVLLEFLEEHAIEFECSGWVCEAVGYIVLGFPNRAKCETRARKLFFRYWRDINSPKHDKTVRRSLQMFKAYKMLESSHARHWRRLVNWMERAAARGLAGTKWFDDFAKSHPKRCACLSEANLQLLRKAFVKIARRYEESPPASAVVLEAVATRHRVSSRALSGFRADARKRTRNPQ